MRYDLIPFYTIFIRIGKRGLQTTAIFRFYVLRIQAVIAVGPYVTFLNKAYILQRSEKWVINIVSAIIRSIGMLCATRARNLLDYLSSSYLQIKKLIIKAAARRVAIDTHPLIFCEMKRGILLFAKDLIEIGQPYESSCNIDVQLLLTCGDTVRKELLNYDGQCG